MTNPGFDGKILYGDSPVPRLTGWYNPMNIITRNETELFQAMYLCSHGKVFP